jgi:hypothetical protein
MAMRMLEAGGIELVADGLRGADTDNPHGYFELEAVKGLDKDGDAQWLGEARGKAVKIVSHLITWLPDSYDYQVIFMERSLDEVIASQNKMLVHRDQTAATGDDGRMRDAYARHLEQTKRFLAGRSCFSTLYLPYRDVVERPRDAAHRIATLLERPLDADAMARAVDPSLYRNRLRQ